MSVRNLLVECVRDHDWATSPASLAGIDGRTARRLLEAAIKHRVAGCAYRSLAAGSTIDPVLLEGLGDEYRKALAHHMRALADLGVAADILEAAGLPFLVIKGPVLSEIYYPDPGLRRYVDVDLLVPPGSLRRAVAALVAGGCRVVERDWACGRPLLSAEVHLMMPFGTPLDLHWHLLNDSYLRAAVRLPMAAMFGRARTVDIAGRAVGTLDAEDTIVHLALHAVISGANRLVWIKDLEQAVLAGADWEVLMERAIATRSALAVGTMLGMARDILGAPVPGDVLRRLPARVWCGLIRSAERASPFEEPSASAASSRVVRSTGVGLPSSAANLGRRGLPLLKRMIEAKARQLLRGRTAELLDPRPVPIEGAASAFYDAVERAGWPA